MTGLGDIGRIDGDGFSFACEMLADDRGVERKPVESFIFKKVTVGLFRKTSIPAQLEEVYTFMDTMNNFMVSMNVFSKGLCIFTTDLRADRHSDWYCIRSVSLAIIR